jgi:DNA-binding CsgD family transcriptional regulator
MGKVLTHYMREWHKQTPYAKPTDFAFPSMKESGKVPICASVFCRVHLRPAAKKAGVVIPDGHRWGLHNLRHSLSNWLVNKARENPKARGLFCRSASVKMLRKCLLAVHQGQVWADTAQMQVILEAVESPSSLTAANPKSNSQLRKREMEVLACVAAGLNNRQIAEQLRLSEHTVKNYLFRLCDKVGRSGRVELMLYALSHRELAATPVGQSSWNAIPA